MTRRSKARRDRLASTNSKYEEGEDVKEEEEVEVEKRNDEKEEDA